MALQAALTASSMLVDGCIARVRMCDDLLTTGNRSSNWVGLWQGVELASGDR